MKTLRLLPELLALKHTFFGLPITLLACFLALSLPEIRNSMSDSEKFCRIIWIVIAFMAARTVGMALNRLFDEPIDRKNPRTEMRALPSGLISRKEVRVVALSASLLLLLTCSFLSREALAFCPLILALLFFYSLAKRATVYCHFVLGAIEFFAPFLGWLAFTGEINFVALFLGFAIFGWISGIDLLYALQDINFDQEWGVYSFPAAFGRVKTLRVARMLHIASCCFFILSGLLLEAAWPYWLTMVVVSLILIRQHRLIEKTQGTSIARLFFLYNAAFSMALLFGSIGTWLVSL